MPLSAAFDRSCRQRHVFSAASKCENLYSQESYRDSKNSCNKVAYDVGKAKHIIENYNDEILDDVVRDIGYGKFYISGQMHRSMENDDAVEPVSDEITAYVAAVEGDVAVGNHEGIEPG